MVVGGGGSVGGREGAPADGRRISWDLVRVCAVFLVLAYHGTWLAVQWHPELEPRRFAFPFQVGASLLLLVSGYFAGVSLLRLRGTSSPGRWWLRRLFRMLPAYVVAVPVTALLMRATAPDGWYAPGGRDVAANLLMLWHVHPDRYAFVDASYWTIPLQLIWFTVLATLWPRGARPTWLRPAAALWAVLAVEVVCYPLGRDAAPGTAAALYPVLGLHRVHLFVGGLTVALWQRRRIGAVAAWPLLAAVVLAQWLQTGWASWAVGLGAGILAVVAAALGPDWRRLLGRRGARAVSRLAGITYGVYLMHQSVGYIVMRRLQDLGAAPSVQFAGLVTTALVLGWLLTVLVERPAYRFLDARVGPGLFGGGIPRQSRGAASAAPPERGSMD